MRDGKGRKIRLLHRNPSYLENLCHLFPVAAGDAPDLFLRADIQKDGQIIKREKGRMTAIGPFDNDKIAGLDHDRFGQSLCFAVKWAIGKWLILPKKGNDLRKKAFPVKISAGLL